MSPSRRRRRRASPEWEGREVITVATLPGLGLYARHLGHPEGVDGVHRTTVTPQGVPGRRPASFDAAWLRNHVDDVHVVHVHAVPARLTAQEVSEAVEIAKGAGKPLVVTAYHLSDPSGEDDAHHVAQLDALVPRADAVVTLTDSAAVEIGERWGVQAQVLPHPHVVDFVRMRQERPRWRRGQFLVGAHLANLRCPTDPVRLVHGLAEATGAVEDARLVVHVHETVLDSGSSTYALSTVRRIDAAVREVGGAVRVHRPFTEAQLWDHLFSLDVSVVPGLHGTHSVWPEACHDLGTTAVLPAGSHASGQRECLTYEVGADGVPDAGSLAMAVKTAREQGSIWRADPSSRWKERVGVAESLRRLYERLCGMDRR